MDMNIGHDFQAGDGDGDEGVFHVGLTSMSADDHHDNLVHMNASSDQPGQAHHDSFLASYTSHFHLNVNS